MFSVLMAAYVMLLYRYTHQTDILVGVPSACRDQTEFEDVREGIIGHDVSCLYSCAVFQVVGYFVNPIVVRTSMSDNPTFRTLFHRIRQTVLGAMECQHYPFPLLVDRLQRYRDRSRPPIVQVCGSIVLFIEARNYEEYLSML